MQNPVVTTIFYYYLFLVNLLQQLIDVLLHFGSINRNFPFRLVSIAETFRVGDDTTFRNCVLWTGGTCYQGAGRLFVSWTPFPIRLC
jgi:hypothetical protein